MSEVPLKTAKGKKKVINVGYDQVAGTVTISAGARGPATSAAGTSSTPPSGAVATQVGELTPEYAVSVLASAVLEQPPVSPRAVWAYCTSASKLYDDTLRAGIRRALTADVELESIMGPPEKSRLHRSSVHKRCRQVVALYNSELRDSLSETTAAKAKMHEALRVTIASAVRLARITSSVSGLLIKEEEEEEELPGPEASSSGNAEEEALAAAAAAPLDLSAAAEAVEEAGAEAAVIKTEEQEESENTKNEDTRVLAVLIQGFGELEKTLVRHLHNLELLIDQEQKANPNDCRLFFDQIRDEFLIQVRRLQLITDDLACCVSAKGPSTLPSPNPPALAAASSSISSSASSPARQDAPHTSRSHSTENRSKDGAKRKAP